jgi:homoserine O-succinyltransferase/O-acetyltransferase
MKELPMPVKIPDSLPAKEVLERENIFVMGEHRALTQDIRPLRIAILNLMPTKIETETQFLRLLSNSPLQVDITLLRMNSHVSKNTHPNHLVAHYQSFSQIQDEKFDGLIVTGAPVEHLPFEQVDYWPELQEILDWKMSNVYSTIHICWGAQAGLFHQFGIPKYPLQEKMFGVFPHRLRVNHEKLLRGFDDEFFAPHSRHTEIRHQDIQAVPQLEILAESDIAGIYIVATRDRRQFYITGHSEYNPLTLKYEYLRDLNKGLPIHVPLNYFPDDDPDRKPLVRWRGHASMLFSNWLNYYVYQITPYDIRMIPQQGTYSDF